MSFLDPEMNKIPEETLDISISYKREVDSYWNLYSYDKGTSTNYFYLGCTGCTKLVKK